MIEILTKLISKRIHSIGIKPLKSLPKERRKVLRKMKFAFIDLKNTNHPSYTDLKTEHDGVIVCKKTKHIKKYKIRE